MISQDYHSLTFEGPQVVQKIQGFGGWKNNVDPFTLVPGPIQEIYTYWLIGLGRADEKWKQGVEGHGLEIDLEVWKASQDAGLIQRMKLPFSRKGQVPGERVCQKIQFPWNSVKFEA